MSFADVLDFAHVMWSERMGGPDTLDAYLAATDAPETPPDEGMEAQARQDAMLAN